jgi:hypothetical protein
VTIVNEENLNNVDGPKIFVNEEIEIMLMV